MFDIEKIFEFSRQKSKSEYEGAILIFFAREFKYLKNEDNFGHFQSLWIFDLYFFPLEEDEVLSDDVFASRVKCLNLNCF